MLAEFCSFAGLTPMRATDSNLTFTRNAMQSLFKIFVVGLIMSLMSATPGISHQEQEQQKQNTDFQELVKLEIVQLGHPVLRQCARELTKEEILSPEIQQLIQRMKLTIQGVGVGVAAPQVGLSIQLAVIEDTEDFHKTIPPELLKQRERAVVPFHVIINPKITLDESEMVEFFEGCLSGGDCMGLVPRARFVRVECLNEKAEPVVIEAKGWYARILQHEIDHLQGNLFLDRAYTRSLTTMNNYKEYWLPQPIEDVRQSVKKHTCSHEKRI
jgi:peptide deformylase